MQIYASECHAVQPAVVVMIMRTRILRQNMTKGIELVGRKLSGYRFVELDFEVRRIARLLGKSAARLRMAVGYRHVRLDVENRCCRLKSA